MHNALTIHPTQSEHCFSKNVIEPPREHFIMHAHGYHGGEVRTYQHCPIQNGRGGEYHTKSKLVKK